MDHTATVPMPAAPSQGRGGAVRAEHAATAVHGHVVHPRSVGGVVVP